MGNFCNFSGKLTVLVPLRQIYTFLGAFEKKLNFENLNTMKLPSPFSNPLLTGHVQNTFKRLYFRVNALSDLTCVRHWGQSFFYQVTET